MSDELNYELQIKLLLLAPILAPIWAPILYICKPCESIVVYCSLNIF